MGRYSVNYPMVLDITYPVSQRIDDELVLHNVEIGSICLAGENIFISWYDHNTREFGVDKVDWDNKLDGAYLETKIIPVYRRAYANYVKYLVAYNSIPERCAIEMHYSTDYGVTYTELTMIDDTDRKIVSADLSVEATTIMIKVVSRTIENTSPTYESAGVGVA